MPKGQRAKIMEKPRRSNATFLHDGDTTSFDYLEFRARWWRLAGWKKAARAGAAVAVIGWLPWGLWNHLAGTERVTAAALGVAAGCGMIRAVLWRDGRDHRRKVAQFAEAIALPAGHPPAVAWSAVQVPADYLDREDAEIIVGVPPEFTGGDRDMEDITRAVTVKLGLLNPKVEKALDSHRPRLIYTKSAPPPLLVTASDVMPAILAAKRFELVLGKGQRGRDGKHPVITTSVKTDTPHGGLGMASQEGKSVAAMNQGCQMAHQGAILMILDYKMLSHMWADGLPNVCYAYTPEMIHQALMWLGWDERDAEGNIIRESELTRRKKVGRASADIHGNVTANVGDPLFIIAEELNATQKQLRNYWRQIGGKGAPPSAQVLDEVAFTGAALDVYALYIAQRFGARSSSSDGSRDAMENIGCFILKDPPPQTWDLVAAGHAQPPASGHKGRYQVVTRKEVREMQGVLWTPQEARKFAVSGKVAVPRFDMPFVNHAAPLPAGVGQEGLAGQEAPEQGIVLTQETPALAPGTGPDRAVTLAQMVAAGLVVSIGAARKLPKRHGWEPVNPDAPPGVAKLYRLGDVYADLKARGKL